MKRVLVVMLMAAVVMSLASLSFAQGRHHGGQGFSQVSSEQQQQFTQATAPLRQSLMEKQAQLNALLYNKDADAAQIGNLQKEVFQLRRQIWEKAQAAGIPCLGGRGGCSNGMGMGMGMGRGMCAAF